MSAESASRIVRQLGREAGFDLVRITEADELLLERERYLAWVAEGRQGEMRWITPERAERSADAATVLPGARSVICVALSYWAGHRPSDGPGTTPSGTPRGYPVSGKVARYAWGRDYHTVLGERLHALTQRLTVEFGGEHRWYVDTGPLMDKALAVRAGIGPYGKNTNLLAPGLGSFVLLGEIVTTLALQPDRPLPDVCGSCRLCMVACPTGALDAEYVIDSRKCISYLTIEHRGPIPRELRAAMGSWVFGCDICQDVCPPTMMPHLRTDEDRRAWAGEVRALVRGDAALPATFGGEVADSSSSPLFVAGVRPRLDLLWLLALTHEEYVQAFRGSSIKRAKVWMLRRNAAVALGNVGEAECIRPLAKAMREDEHRVVRGHAAWALGRLYTRLGLPQTPELLHEALEEEPDDGVREEIKAALLECEEASRAVDGATRADYASTLTQRQFPSLQTSHGGKRTPS